MGFFLTILLLALIALQFPQTQKFITQKVVMFLSEKWQTRVEVGGINIGFPKSILITDIYIEDQDQDTLWYSHEVEADINFYSLLKSKIVINSLDIENVTAHVKRTLPDSSFNFDFIIQAFASNSVEVKQKADTTEKSKWTFTILNVNLSGINFTFSDEPGGNNIALNLGELNIELNEFDMEHNKFDVALIALINTNADFVQYKAAEETEEEPSPLDLNFSIDKILLAGIQFNYHNKVSSQKMAIAIGESTLEAHKMALTGQEINLEKLELHNSHFSFVQDKNANVVNTKDETDKETKKIDTGSGWKILLNELNFSGNSFRFDDFNSVHTEKGMDFNHLYLAGIIANIKKIYHSDNNTSANIHHLSLEEKSGFQIEKFRTQFFMDPKKIELKNLDLSTGESRITDHLAISSSSLEDIADSVVTLNIHANFKQTKIGFQDVLYFVPELSKNPAFSENQGNSIYIKGKIDGTIADILIRDLELRTAQSTRLKASGRITGLPETEKIFFDINLEELVTGSNDIRLLIPDTMLSSFNFPSEILANGNFKGYMKDFHADMAVKTSQGQLSADITMNTASPGQIETYSGKLSTTNFDIGELLNQRETLGKISLTTSFNGRGFKMEELNTMLNATVQKAVLKGYEYKDLKIEGIFKQEQFTGKVNIEDENLVFNFDGDINFRDTIPDVNFKLDLLGANLKALHLSEEDFRIKGIITADMTGNNLDNVNGNIGIREVLIVKNGKSYPIDSLVFVSIKEGENANITVDSDFMTAWFKGTINLDDLPKVMHVHLHQYFKLHHEMEENLQPQNFDFGIALFKTEFLTEIFVPDLQALDSIVVKGTYNSLDKVLDADLSIAHLVYSNITMDSLMINVNSDASKLNYSVHLSEISDSAFQVKNPTVIGLIENNNAEVKLQFTDDAGKERFVLGGAFTSMETDYRFHLFPSQVIFNYEKWNVPEDNYLLFGKDKLLAHNIRLENNDRLISINSLQTNQERPPMEVAFNNFNIAVLSKLFERKEQLLSGIINGSIVLEKPQEELIFTSDITINDFSFKGDTLGNIALKANNEGREWYNINLDITGNENLVNATGYYLPKPGNNSFNFDLHLDNLNLSTVEAFTGGQLTQLSGSLTGQMKILGTIEKPWITGNLNFKNAAFNLTYLNSYLTLKDEKISIDQQGINFESFMLVDSIGNKANVKGNIYTQNYRDYRFNLNVTTNNFLVINTTSSDNELYYGKIIVDSDISIRGDQNKPIIDARLKLLEGSDITFVVPADNLATVEREGIVEFIDMDQKANPITDIQETQDTLRAELRALDLKTNVDIDKNTRIKIIIDEIAGDYLEVLGSATASFGIDPSGKISLSGRYEIDEGTYRLTFQEFVKRQFDIKKGSSITWNGDPLDAQVDISAIYTVRTSPYELLATAQTTEQDRELFKQQLPFQVYLNMKGELMTPDIDFDMDMPLEERSALDGQVYAKLQQLNENEGELNKQVFAILVLNRFITEDVFGGETGGYASTARTSVSRILTQQLNKLSSEYVTGVDLTFDVESYQDYSTGEEQGRTELEVGLSKQFLDERITVQVEGNVDVEGEQREQTGLSDIAGDVSIEYKLTDDGRYKLRVFRENEFQGFVDVNIIETGIAIIYNKDYTRFFKPVLKLIKSKFKREERTEDEQVIKNEGY